MNGFPWQSERDPEKALEKIFDTIADSWYITEEPFSGASTKRTIVFTLNRDFNPHKVYPREYAVEGIVE